MSPDLTILYRGPLSSCNYDCSYCPFAKRHETAAQLTTDRLALERFVEWVQQHSDVSLAIFFTPWGEALTRRWYHKAFQQLTHLSHVSKVAAQTNLSWSQHWLEQCDVSRMGLWCTYHPSQTSREDFVKRSQELTDRGVNHSVGMVGLPDDFDEIEALRKELPDSIYLWINAWGIGDGTKFAYSKSQTDRLVAVDPLFKTNTVLHPSFGRSCDSGSSVISVDGDGTIRRCHFVRNEIGNIYDSNFSFHLPKRTCPKATCGCHIGYVHMPDLQLQSTYGEAILERIPLATVTTETESG